MAARPEDGPALAPPMRTGAVLNITATTPKLFQPMKIRGMELQNRIVVSPMGMYSSLDGRSIPFHLIHIGSFAVRGPGLTFVEATAVLRDGRTSPADAGLWSDSQVKGMKDVVEFVHGLGQKVGIQLAHAGRKSSMLPIIPGKKIELAKEEDGGWADKVVAPSAVAFAEGYPVPKEMSEKDIKEVISAFKEAAKRAVRAGFGMTSFLISAYLIRREARTD